MLGHLGGLLTIMIRSWMSGSVDSGRAPERRRRDAVIDGIGELLDSL
jgi:5'-nucleotidase